MDINSSDPTSGVDDHDGLSVVVPEAAATPWPPVIAIR